MKLLEGIRILDFTEYNCFSSFLLTEYGAEVIKVERPGGEPMRVYEPQINGGSPYGTYLNRGRKSISINMRAPGAADYIKELVKDIDIVYENFKGGTMEKYGISYEDLKQANPNLIFASLSSYGSTGPMAQYPGFDNISQAMSGLMDITGFQDGPPRVLGYAAGDQVSSVSTQIAILLGVLSRYRTGKGQKAESSIYESLFHATNVRLILNQLNGRHMGRKGNASLYYAPCDTFRAADGAYVAIAVTRPAHWTALCNAFQLGDWERAYPDNAARMDAYDTVIQPKLAELCGQYDTPALLELLEANGVPNANVKEIDEAINSALTYQRDMLAIQPDDTIGPFIMPNRFIKHTDSEREIGSLPPVGRDTREILASIGVDAQKYQELIEAEIVKF